MDLLPSLEQTQIIDSITGFLDAEAPVSRLLERSRQHASAERQLWTKFAELGWFGLGLPENLGGFGYSVAEDLLLFRELGRHLISPNVLAARIGAEVAAQAGERGLAQQIIGGQIHVAIANRAGPGHLGIRSDGSFHLLDGQPDDMLVSWTDDGVALFAADAFEKIEAIPALDEIVPLSIGVLGRGNPVVWLPADNHALADFGTVMLAALLCGIAEAVRDSSVEYARTRLQFGVKIGSFQAIKHKCADMAVNAEAAWAQTVLAALCYGQPKIIRQFESAAAKLLAVDAATIGAATNIQIHGGLGFAAECAAHLFLKRARLLEQLGGACRVHRPKLLTEH